MKECASRKVMRQFGGIMLVLALLYSIVTMLPWSTGFCVEQSSSESYSPEGQYLARVYVRDCGATTGYVTHVNPRSRWSWFHTNWIGTITDGEVLTAVSPPVNLVWRDAKDLEIQYQHYFKSGGSESVGVKRSS
jgi:hypothetical protein